MGKYRTATRNLLDRFIGEKSVEMLLSELDSLNTQNSAAAGLVTGFKDIHDMVQKELHLFVRKPSWTKKTKLMNRWDASDVKQWTAWLLKKKESAKSYMDTNLAEAVAVMMRANFLFNGQTPRAAQVRCPQSKTCVCCPTGGPEINP